MRAIKTVQPLSVEAYLAGEPDSDVRHEYIGYISNKDKTLSPIAVYPDLAERDAVFERIDPKPPRSEGQTK